MEDGQWVRGVTENVKIDAPDGFAISRVEVGPNLGTIKGLPALLIIVTRKPSLLRHQVVDVTESISREYPNFNRLGGDEDTSLIFTTVTLSF